MKPSCYSLFHSFNTRQTTLFNPKKNFHLRNYLIDEITKSLKLSTYKEFSYNHQKPILSIAFDMIEGRYMLSGGMDCKICLYDVEDYKKNIKKKMFEIEPVFEINEKYTHKYAISTLEWYTKDTGLFFSGGFDNYLSIWDTNEVKKVVNFKYSKKIYSISYSPISNNHSLIAVGYGKSAVSLADMIGGKFTHLSQGHKDSVLTVKWSPFNENILVSGSRDGTILMYDIRRGGILKSFNKYINVKDNLNIYGLCEKKTFQKAHDGVVNGLMFLKDRNYLLSMGNDSKLKLWDVEKGVVVFEKYEGIVNNSIHELKCCISNNGKYVFHPNGEVIDMYNIFNGEKCNTLDGHFDLINSCVYHLDKEQLFSCSNDGYIHTYTPEKENKNMERIMNKKK